MEKLVEKIVKIGNKYQVQSEKGRNLGTYNTREEAEKRLKQVEYFKHINEANSLKDKFLNWQLGGEQFNDIFSEEDINYMKKHLSTINTPIYRCEILTNKPNLKVGDIITYDRFRSFSKDKQGFYDVMFMWDDAIVNENDNLVCFKTKGPVRIFDCDKEFNLKYNDLTDDDFGNTLNTQKEIFVEGKFKVIKIGKVYDDYYEMNHMLYTIEQIDTNLEENLNEDLQETDNEGNILSKEQIEFFKDSKARDKNGKLLVCNHFTNANFDTFEYDYIGSNFNGKLMLGQGFYFTQANNSSQWTSYKDLPKDIKMAVYLNIKNPYILENQEHCDLLYNKLCSMLDTIEDKKERAKQKSKIAKRKASLFWWQAKMLQFIKNNKEILKITSYDLLQSMGFDGVFAYTGNTNKDFNQLVAFYPNQIKLITNKTPTNSSNINEKLDFNRLNNKMIADYLSQDSLSEPEDMIGSSLLLPSGEVYNIDSYETHALAAGSIYYNLFKEDVSEDELEDSAFDYIVLEYFEEDFGIITLASGDGVEERCKVVVCCKPTDAQVEKLYDFFELMFEKGKQYVYIYANNMQKTYSLIEKTPKELVKNILGAFTLGRLRENKAIHFGDLDKGIKAETRRVMSGGRGTGHFGTGFYFVSKDGARGIDQEGNLKYDYQKDRPIYEIELDNYNLYKPKDNETAYKLHDAFKEINNYYSPDIKYLLNKKLDEEKILDELYEIGWNAGELEEDFNEDDFDDFEYSILDNYDDSEIMTDEEKDRIYKEKYIELVKFFIEKYHLENFIYTNYMDLDEWLEKSKVGEIENNVKDAVESLIECLYYINIAIKNASNILNVDRNKLIGIIDKAANTKSEDTISTLIMKALGYEGIDVTHLNHDAQGLSGLDNFGYGTVVYDLKPGTYKRIKEPRVSTKESFILKNNIDKNNNCDIILSEDNIMKKNKLIENKKIDIKTWAQKAVKKYSKAMRILGE